MGQNYRKKVRIGDLRLGPLRHESIPNDFHRAVEWTYDIVGRYVQPTLEQWELGFMRDTHMGREIGIWILVAGAFQTYHERNGLPLRSEAEEVKLVSDILAVGSRNPPKGMPTSEVEMLRECLAGADIPEEHRWIPAKYMNT
jgi:hypothetical protein